MIKLRNILSIMGTVLCTALMIITSTSCDGIYDDLQPCPQGVRLRFVYDYNMEFANSFHKKVDCVTLYIFNEKGEYLSQVVETSDALADENYRMLLDLDKGNYRLVAYGGLACEEHAFSVVTPSDISRASHYTQLQVAMDMDKLGTSLHGFYYGTLEVTVGGNDYVDATLGLMKNTNNIRIMLQQVNADVPLDVNDFAFAIADDNTLFAHDNALIPNGVVEYSPWTQGMAEVGSEGEGEDAQVARVAFAELSTSRLVKRADYAPRLRIVNRETGKDVVNIPLINYLLLLKSELYADMGAQEFLDRESEWSLLFFLNKDGSWLRTQIVINDWVVRLNETDF